ncbi:MAG: tRNA (adenosine(37)-N6)-dimethylallyltransferase MiaA [Rhodospirillales bacterium]
MGEGLAMPLVAVIGPTGSGKSELALNIAAELDGEIVNCDSLQIYRYLDIGTAKVLPHERRGIPHHLLDLLNPDEVFAAGEYARVARPLLREIAARGRLPVVAGGAGFYLRALIDGLFPGPTRSDKLRRRLARRERNRPGWLHGLLARYDPPSAERIHATDVQKLIRAAEVLLETKRPLSSWFAEPRDALEGFRVLKIGLDPPRTALYERLDARCARMFEGGLLDEVRRVMEMGFPPDSKALQSHGYRQAVQVIEGTLDLKKALYLAQRDTRRYAKRQWTWFRRDQEVRWLRGFGDDPEVLEGALKEVRGFVGRL